MLLPLLTYHKRLQIAQERCAAPNVIGVASCHARWLLAKHRPRNMFAVEFLQVSERIEAARKVPKGRKPDVCQVQCADMRERGQQRREVPVNGQRRELLLSPGKRLGGFLAIAELVDTQPPEVAQLSPEDGDEQNRRAVRDVEVASQRQRLDVPPELRRRIQERGEAVEGLLVAEEDVGEEDLLSSRTPGTAYEGTTGQRR